MKEFRHGLGALFQYDDGELEQALERHPQLENDLGEGVYVQLRRIPGGPYVADLHTADGRSHSVRAATVTQTLNDLRELLNELRPGGETPT